nr:hypothetical protein Itr_chr11CG10300 [Ipomoea trifida]
MVFKTITVKFVITHNHQNFSAYSNSSGVNVVIIQRNKSVIRIKHHCIFPHLRLIPSNFVHVKHFEDIDKHFIPQDINLTKPSIKCSQSAFSSLKQIALETFQELFLEEYISNSVASSKSVDSKAQMSLYSENSKMDPVHHKILDELVRRQEDFQDSDKKGLICHGNKVIDYGGRMVMKYGASSLDKQPGI